MIEIIGYQDEYFIDFRQLNLEWLELYALVEEHDLEILDNPRSIIAGGGDIFLARLDSRIVGTAALAKMDDETYELIKMSVAPDLRGEGIGKMLLQHAIEKAKALQAKTVLLYSNSRLQAAVKMYEKCGFQHIPVTDSPFVTADIKMQLSL